jgi:hypothetical protein
MIKGFNKAQEAYDRQTPYDNEREYFCPNCKEFLSDEDYNSEEDKYSCCQCGFEFDSGEAYSKYDVHSDALDFEAERMEDRRLDEGEY